MYAPRYPITKSSTRQSNIVDPLPPSQNKKTIAQPYTTLLQPPPIVPRFLNPPSLLRPLLLLPLPHLRIIEHTRPHIAKDLHIPPKMLLLGEIRAHRLVLINDEMHGLLVHGFAVLVVEATQDDGEVFELGIA